MQIFTSKSHCILPRGLFKKKSHFSPPPIWLRLPTVIFVFVCVCIFVFVYFLSFRVYFVYLYSYLRRICVFPAFSAADSPRCLTIVHLPVKLTAVRWDSTAPFINRLQPAERYFWAFFRILTPFFCISATNARQFFKSRTSPPPCQGIVVLFQVLTSLSGSEIWHCSTPATAVTLVFDWMMLESWEKLISVNTTLAVAPLSWSNSQWYHGTIIELK